MSALFQLTWRYITYHKVKSLLLLLALALTLFLPVAASALVNLYEEELTRRAEATPLVIGNKGDRFDLVLKTLYFTGEAPEAMAMAEFDALQDTGRAMAIPLHLGFTAGGLPVVGTTPDYFTFRNLRAARGSLPVIAGEVVLGHKAAAELGLEPGDALPSDQVNLYDLSAAYPLRMKVTGVLAPSGTPDDRAAITSLQTAWVIAGLGHGHDKLDAESAPQNILGRSEEQITASAAVEQFIEITPENVGDFHFHGELSEMPVTALIAVPNSSKDATLLKGKYSVAESVQMLDPNEVVAELLGVVFRVKRFFDASFAFVLLAAGLFLTLIVLLSLRLRRRERQTLFRMGCSRGTIATLQAMELLIIGFAALILAALAAAALLIFAPSISRTLHS